MLYDYIVYCTDCVAWKEIPSNDNPPVAPVCPTNPAHTLDMDSLRMGGAVNCPRCHPDATTGASGFMSATDKTNAHANTNDPTSDQKAALAGNNGSPSTSNKYVTETGLVAGLATVPAGCDPITHGGTVLNPAAATNVVVWRAPFACTVVAVRGYRVGGSGATINARLNGASNHLASDLSLTSADTWMTNASVQNATYADGDKLEIMVVTETGSPTQVAVQVDFSYTHAQTVSRGGTVMAPTGAVNIIVWQATTACTVTKVWGYRDGGTGATINARRKGSDNHLSSALSLTSDVTWMDGGAVQNTALAAGDKLEIMIVSVTGTPTLIAVQVDATIT